MKTWIQTMLILYTIPEAMSNMWTGVEIIGQIKLSIHF